jgi:hypothetical protein
MSGKMPGKSNDGRRKNNERNHHYTNGGRSGGRQGNDGRGGRGRCRGGCGGRSSNNIEHLKTIEYFNCGKKGHYYMYCSSPRKNDNKNSNMVSKADFKNLFQSSLKNMLNRKEKQTKKKDNMEVVDLYPRRQSDRALSALNYRLTPDCHLSQSSHGCTPIACAHTTGNSNTNELHLG